MDHKTLVDVLLLGGFGAMVAFWSIYFAVKKKKTYIPNIIDLEKRRKAHPDMQTGRFNRIYTMPYDDEVNAYTIRKYLEELYPDYTYSISKGTLHIEENQSDEERILIFTQLRDEDITAIELKDPHEVIQSGGFRGRASTYTTRTSLHDLGFSQSIRDAILHFQEQAVNKRNR